MNGKLSSTVQEFQHQCESMMMESEMKVIMLSCSREEVEEFFASMDRDFDGRLTFEEFMGEETTLEKLFKNMDKNGDGVVTKKEFMSICKNLTDEQVKMAFSKFDTSGDDKLDYREFCEMIRKKEEERNT